MNSVLLAGRPNSGKSSLFNRIASANQKVGNYAGVTVEKKTALVEGDEGQFFSLTDLPGLYSLVPNSMDEQVALKAIEEDRNSIIAFVCDGNNLEQELVLPLMLKQKGYEIVIAVNMIDEVRANKKILDLNGMSELVGVPFFPLSAKTGEGVASFKKFLARKTGAMSSLPKATEAISDLPKEQIVKLYQKAKSQAQKTKNQGTEKSYLSLRDKKIDRWLLHPVLGPLIFFATMFVLFQSIFTWAAPLSDALETLLGFAQQFVRSLVVNPLLASLLSDGLLAGIGAVVVFVPQIAILFFLIGLLEYSGYLPRIAYLVDRLLKPYGLDGKVFIPLLSSVACAVPGIMATRTIENQRTRLVTIIISPLMTCSARLPVYALLIACFVPEKNFGFLSLQGLTMFALYALGAVAALAVALVLHWVGFEKKGALLEMIHLPHYRSPDWSSLGRFVWQRVYVFLKKAGTIIAVMAMLVWALLSFPRNASVEEAKQAAMSAITANTTLSIEQKEEKILLLENEAAAKNLELSFGGSLGKSLEPLFAPLGYDWKLTVGLLASLAAREVFVATIGTVFALGAVEEGQEAGLIEVLRQEKNTRGEAAYTLATALSLLVFFAFSLQCISTIGVARRETNSWKIPALMFCYMFSLAYGAAFLAYRVGLVFL